MEAPSFDRDTARIFNRRPGGSRHLAYKDAAGSICLWVKSTLGGGGCAISANAIEWLDSMPGDHFVRLTNEIGKLDEIMARADIPMGEGREGQFGPYFIVELDDLREDAPPF